ncbi:HAD-IIIC family phosphatase [Sphingomonas oryzagri]|uniref:HAD-IIIC family phosphatase n=1 Tax=Sphingomonas oryzagri TaxID=3042314 RepID=A0ABT6N362_9SPHN|nr:HAD-IIIC family phosphatase [Sphingomonas oryzagri]MDH7639198.1 HAD-IIIC family phosphatase [Sphingomonas oryzagri]
MLSWLPEHRDAGACLRQAQAAGDGPTMLATARMLAGHRRDAQFTNRIDRLARAALAATPTPALAEARVAILSSHTIDHLVPAVRVAGLHRGMVIEVHAGDYGQFRSPMIMGCPWIERFAPHMILFAIDLPALLEPIPLSAGRDAVETSLAHIMEELRQLWSLARERFGAQPVQQTFLPQASPLLGSNEALLPASPWSCCARLNDLLRQASQQGEVLLLDVANQLPGIGEGRLYDEVRWYQAKQLVNPLVAPAYGELVARLAAAVIGRSRKSLVLDLDNTLWGGVVGDDGVENLRLGQGSAEGEAYIAFQRYVARLAERGIIIAVCSKNDHATARSVFDRHPDMQIAFDDIACFVANWADKASNLRHIARTLNIGLDSMVFVDDNPAEREIIRRELPEVAVPELPEDPAGYMQCIADGGYFESLGLTSEDLARSGDYTANNQRAAVRASTTDMDGYLQSLDMTLTAGPISSFDRSRAAQLINKSNQFNLTTRRRTADELHPLLEDARNVILAFRLRDRFGDNGLISVIVARPDAAWSGGELLIDTWLMSCRVLGRGVELAALCALRSAAVQAGATALIGEYRPSGRNGMVEAHYEKLGFERIAADTPGEETFWRMSLQDGQVARHHLKLELTI